MEVTSVRLLLWITGAGAVYFVLKLFIARRHVYALARKQLPMPRYHPIFGHFLELKKAMDKVPPDSTINTALAQMMPDFPNGIFYLDLWPISKPLLVMATPSSGFELQNHPLDKPEEIYDAFQHLTGGHNLFTMKEEMWKPWRGIFNHGFSAGYMLGLAPAIAEQTRFFCNALAEKAHEGTIFKLEELTLKLAIDVIGKVTLNTEFKCQQKENLVAMSLRELIAWTSFGSELNPFNRYRPARRLMQWYYGRQLDSVIHKELYQRFNELRDSRLSSSAKTRSLSKSVTILALQNYLADKNLEDIDKLDQEFREVATAQIRLFLFAGHDTTSSTLVYCYYLLGTHPDKLTKIRAEFDLVFGTGTGKTSVYDAIVRNPQTLNQLPYTSAVIKETMRLFPAASAMRGGKAGVFMTDDSGVQFPSEGCNIWVVHLLLQRHPKYWKDPDSFIPERWLVEDPTDPWYPPKGGWRAFEYGPRNCIGQNLATLEMRVVLAMTLAVFDVRPAYEEWDRLYPSDGVKTAFGHRAYQIEGNGGGAHPSEWFPCEVALRPGRYWMNE